MSYYQWDKLDCVDSLDNVEQFIGKFMTPYLSTNPIASRHYTEELIEDLAFNGFCFIGKNQSNDRNYYYGRYVDNKLFVYTFKKDVDKEKQVA